MQGHLHIVPLLVVTPDYIFKLVLDIEEPGASCSGKKDDGQLDHQEGLPTHQKAQAHTPDQYNQVHQVEVPGRRGGANNTGSRKHVVDPMGSGGPPRTQNLCQPSSNKNLIITMQNSDGIYFGDLRASFSDIVLNPRDSPLLFLIMWKERGEIKQMI